MLNLELTNDLLCGIKANENVRSFIKELEKFKEMNKYNEILKDDENIDYKVFSNITGKNYTILSFEDEGTNIIKMPNSLLPKDINSRTVLNLKNGKFEINQDKTDINNNIWEEKQKTEEILKEGRIYFVDAHRNDYTEVIAVDNGEKYKLDFMSPYIGRRLKLDVNEGEYIIARDNKFEKYAETINVQNETVKEIIEKRENEIERDTLKRKENLIEGQEFKVKYKISDSRFIVESESNGELSYMGLYVNEAEKEELQIDGIGDIYCYKTNSETKSNLQEGDKLITNNEKIIKEGTKDILNGTELSVKQYEGKADEIYVISKIQGDTIKITSVQDNQNLTVKRENDVNIQVGDFIKTKDIGYEKYDGIVKIENSRAMDDLSNLYNFVID